MSKIKLLEATDYLRIRLEKLLMHYGYNGTEVLDGLINNNARYTFKESDLVIMDLDNRQFDVVSIISELKSDPLTTQIPIMLLSSQSDIKTLKRAITAGCTEFVTKPFSDELLVQKIHKLTKRTYKDLGLPEEFSNEPQQTAVNFKWQKDYEIGIETIDSEHKSIIDNYEKLYSYMKTGKGHDYYSEIVNFMRTYIDEHFSHEEAFQEEIQYDKRAEHAMYHEDFKKSVERIIQDYDGKTVSNMNLVRINLFLKDWILHHILVEDAKIGEFYKRQTR